MCKSARVPRTLRAPLATAVALLVLVAAACGGGGDSDRLTVYSGRTENLIGPLLEQFSEDTGVAIDVLYGDSADLAVQIDTEGDRSPADVFVSQSPGAVGFLDGEGRLVPLADDVLGLVPERFRAGDGQWVGLSGRVRVVVYNADAVSADELPSSVFDLVDERYAGRVGVAPTNGSFQDFVTGMRELVGDDRTLEWLEALVDNGVRTYPNNDAIRQAAERGEVDFGLVNHYYNERAKREDPSVPTENHLLDAGDPGTMILVTAAAVLDTAGDRQDDANRLVEYLLSRDAQEFFAEQTLEYPLAAGVDPLVEDLPPLDDIAAPRLELDSLGGGLQRTRELIRESGLERS
jgi:iron(III) transport system substrate-binding protein